MNLDRNPRGYFDETIVLEQGSNARIEADGNAFEVLSYTGDPTGVIIYPGRTTHGSAETFDPGQTAQGFPGSVRVAQFDFLEVKDSGSGGKLRVRVHQHRGVATVAGEPPSSTRRRHLASTPDEITWAAPAAGVWDIGKSAASTVKRDGLVAMSERLAVENSEVLQLLCWDGWVYCSRDFDLLVYAALDWDGTSAAGSTDFKLVQRFESNSLNQDGTHGDVETAYPELHTGGTNPGCNIINLADAANYQVNDTGSEIHNDQVGNGAKIPRGQVRVVLTWDGAVEAKFRFWIGARG